MIWTLETAEEKIGEIIMKWPNITGAYEVAMQKSELAGYIEGLAENGLIAENVRGILNAVYFEGWCRYKAIKYFGNIKKSKVKKVSEKTLQVKVKEVLRVENQEVTKNLENMPDDLLG